MSEASNEGLDDWVDVEGASSILGVPAAQVMAMAEQGLITPQGDDVSQPRFRRAELLAAREVGG